MVEFCFETINWSPYLGHEDPDAGRLVAAAAAAGFEWISFDEQLLAAWREGGEDLEGLRRRVDDSGLRTLAIHAVAIGDDAAVAAEATRPLAEAAGVLGAPYLQVGGAAPLGPALYEATQAVADVAKTAGACLGVEFLPIIPVASIEQTRQLLRSVDAPGSGLVVDTWHFFHGPDDWADLEGLAAEEIVYLQFDDHPPLESDDLLEETIHRRVLPGEGTFELDRFAKTLRAVGFDGVIGLEHLSRADRGRPVEEVAPALLAAAKRFWSV